MVNGIVYYYTTSTVSGVYNKEVFNYEEEQTVQHSTIFGVTKGVDTYDTALHYTAIDTAQFHHSRNKWR